MFVAESLAGQETFGNTSMLQSAVVNQIPETLRTLLQFLTAISVLRLVVDYKVLICTDNIHYIVLVRINMACHICYIYFVLYKHMNARESENYLAILRSSSAIKSVVIVWAEIYRGRLFLGPNLVSFNRTVVPCEISKVNFRIETKNIVSMSDEI